MKVKSICVFASAIGLAVAIAPAASAVTVVKPFVGGPFSPANPLGTIDAIRLVTTNTYDFTFTVSGGGSLLTQIQASVFGPNGPQQIQYTLYSGTPGSGTFVDMSTLMVGPSLTDTLDVGKYYVQVDYIAQNRELLTGGLAVTAVPEPAAWGVMLLGLAGLGAPLRSNRRKAALATA